MYDVAVLGGGLAGLTNAYLLAKVGYKVILFEKGNYPQHKVCGEYVSNEVLPFLKQNNLYPKNVRPSQINKFQLTTQTGKSVALTLDKGAFGISRFAFDDYLYQKCRDIGVVCLTKTKVHNCVFEDPHFNIFSSKGMYQAYYAVGSFGKKSNLDRVLNRHIKPEKSSYLGVKYHIKTDFSLNTVALHNFRGGYCGVNKIEGDLYNICYLTKGNNLKQSGSIKSMEMDVLFKNPYIKELFKSSDFIFNKPLIINNINFNKKQLIENYLITCGDTAGLITPLCGNGMAMAIHSGKLLAEIIIQNKARPDLRNEIQNIYSHEWNRLFSNRLKWGRKLHPLFGNYALSNAALALAKFFPDLAKKLISKTHGKSFI
ncbi:MAG: FAD-dependent oxidoreductase [Flammeovirgaceae bacterium]|nr:FAD-dependent oxidoreductase [Flammeovirgaceae bacterium]